MIYGTNLHHSKNQSYTSWQIYATLVKNELTFVITFVLYINVCITVNQQYHGIGNIESLYLVTAQQLTTNWAINV